MSQAINAPSRTESDMSKPIVLCGSRIRLRPRLNLPPQPIWFPPTASLAPEAGQKKKALKFNDVVREDAVIGYIRQVSGGNDLVIFYPFDVKTLMSYIRYPHTIPSEHQNIVQKHGHNIFPFSLPDFSDLSLHPRVFKILMDWLLTSATISNANYVLSILLRETGTEMLTRRETYLMGRESRSVVTIRSCGNYFKCVEVDSAVSEKIVISARFSQTTEDPRDGRTCNLELKTVAKGVADLKRKRVMDIRPVGLMVWNCRGVSKWGFETAMEALMQWHMPEYVVLLETRVAEEEMKSALKPFKFRRYVYSNPNGAAGGLAILSKNRHQSLVVTRNNASEIECSVSVST